MSEARNAGDVLAAIDGSRDGLIARGAGRAYGDAALNTSHVLNMSLMNRLLAFNSETGEVVCEAGTLLSDIIDTFLRRGWFPPVTPGTRFVTVGGMIAADVHGKNHHIEGSFGRYVDWLELALASGDVVRCSRSERPNLFNATIGGMGLTGVVLAAGFRLVPVETDLVRQRVIRAHNLSELLSIFDSNSRATYSVAWVDCLSSARGLGRSIVFLGEHARGHELPTGISPFRAPQRGSLRVPFDLPSASLNAITIRGFNACYEAFTRFGEGLIPYRAYFYPLDGLHDWNRIYGRNGFTQHQCVLPLATGEDGLREILSRVARHGTGTFLAVLKRMGPGSPGPLSFPMEGYTLAMDFPVNAATFKLLDLIDEVVVEHGGRIYLAKDARAKAGTISSGYPRLAEFADVRSAVDPKHRISSLLSQRLDL